MARPNKLIQFYLTNMCNSKCNTCNIWKNNSVQELPVDDVMKVINEFPTADYVFGGGEFTTYSQKELLLQQCNEMGINYTVLSNCVNFKSVDYIISKYNIKNLTISCDGLKHDKIRGKVGNLNNIEILLKTRRNDVKNLKLSYTLSRFNEGSIDRDMDYFRNLGFDKIYFCIAQNMDLLKAKGDITPSIESLNYFQESYSYMLYDKDQQMLDDFVHGIHRTCESIRDVHTIYTNGDVVRCQSILSSDVIGNIHKDKFSDILAADRVVNLKDFKCPYNDTCELVCQRRYDYEDRI